MTVVLALCQAQGAEIVASHLPTRNGGPASDNDFIDMFGNRFANFEADEFTLSSPATIGQIRVWGFYDLDNPPATETMRITVYDSRAGDRFPGNAVYEEQFTTFSRVITGQLVFTGVDPHEYLYTFDLVSPLELRSAEQYWLEIAQLGDPTTQWRWEFSVGGNRRRVFRNPMFTDWSLATGSDLAFQLIAIPEPGSGLLAACVAVAAITTRHCYPDKR